jgi:hypothetical protein
MGQGWVPLKPSMPMLHPDGRIAFVNADGTYSVVEHLADAMRSLGRPPGLPVPYSADQERLS